MAKYLIRFDDINSRMDWNSFFTIKKVLEKYNIKSILGVVPKCEDAFLHVSKPIPDFFGNLRRFALYGDVIAQHGYKHIYDSRSKGFYGNTNNSEFSGHSYKKQLLKLSKGKDILEKESLWEPIFMAPNHSFDANTLKALKKLGFRIVLDGFSLFPFKKNGLFFVPQIFSKPLPKFMPGISQLCIHINTISKKELNQLILFITKNHNNFLKLEETIYKNYFPQFFEHLFISIFIRSFRLIKKIKSFVLNSFLKILCIFQRLSYKIKLRNVDIYKWHLSGTFYCRYYKRESLKIINSLKPFFYIDIGCGLGEILNKVELESKFKFGYDKDLILNEANQILNHKNFTYFSNEEKLFSTVNKLKENNDQLIVISMLNFIHDLKNDELEKKIKKYLKIIGNYVLLIDNIYINSKKYKYNHHEFLYTHKGLIKYFHKVDQLRSLYCLEID